jgi:hypothetical protein
LNGASEAPGTRGARLLATLLVLLAFGLCGGALAWFAWVEAPITDGVMVLVSAGLLLEVLAAAAALLALEFGVGGSARSALARRAALGLVLAGFLVLMVAAALTLNLRGTADEDAGGEATVARVAAHGTAGAAERG